MLYKRQPSIFWYKSKTEEIVGDPDSVLKFQRQKYYYKIVVRLIIAGLSIIPLLIHLLNKT